MGPGTTPGVALIQTGTGQKTGPKSFPGVLSQQRARTPLPFWYLGPAADLGSALYIQLEERGKLGPRDNAQKQVLGSALRICEAAQEGWCCPSQEGLWKQLRLLTSWEVGGRRGGSCNLIRGARIVDTLGWIPELDSHITSPLGATSSTNVKEERSVYSLSPL